MQDNVPWFFLAALVCSALGHARLLTSADLPPDNGAHYFLLASETLPAEIRYFDGTEQWDNPEVQARWEEIQKTLDIVREGIDVGNADLPTAASPAEEIPYVSHWRAIARLFLVEANVLRSEGRIGEAVQSYLDAISFANGFSEGGTLHGGISAWSVTRDSLEALQNQIESSIAAELTHVLIQQLEPCR